MHKLKLTLPLYYKVDR